MIRLTSIIHLCNRGRSPMPPKVEIGQIIKVVKTDEEWRKLLAPEAYKEQGYVTF